MKGKGGRCRGSGELLVAVAAAAVLSYFDHHLPKRGRPLIKRHLRRFDEISCGSDVCAAFFSLPRAGALCESK